MVGVVHVDDQTYINVFPIGTEARTNDDELQVRGLKVRIRALLKMT